MNYLRIRGYEGPLLHYSVYNEDGLELKEARVDFSELTEAALVLQVPWMSLLAEREGADVYQPELPNPLPGEPVRLHWHDEFKHSHDLEAHEHPHSHDFSEFYQRLEELWDQMQETLKKLAEHDHHQYLDRIHDHQDYARVQHPHDWPKHDHPVGQHNHTLAEHQHPPEIHSHPFRAHDHELSVHDHPIGPHEHSLPEHHHSLDPHDHPAGAHRHNLEQHDHPIGPHEHPQEAHEHAMGEHEHPHDHKELYGVATGTEALAAPPGVHLHRFDTMLGDGKGWRCGICGQPKESLNA